MDDTKQSDNKKKDVKLTPHLQALVHMWVGNGHRSALTAPLYIDHVGKKVPTGEVNKYGKPLFKRKDDGDFFIEPTEVICWANRKRRRAAEAQKRKRS